ncbi:elongation factor Ts [Candidatus Falkowbacteria bacterium]|nr:elongation factor Ts [Candidatus Falkowbacteria bacterium]
MSNLDQIKELREQTGAGMMEVKKALEEAGNDKEKATEVLKKSGALKAQKKSDRATSEGLVDIKISPDHKKASIIQINCETDFVAKNEIFINLVSELSSKNLETNDAETEFNSRKEDLVLKIGENLTFGRAEVLEAEYISGYLHSNKKVGSLISFSAQIEEELAHDIAMHITALNPGYLKPEDVPVDILEKEKEVYREQLKNQGKPEEIIEKILQGKLAKFYEENCLLNQPFVKDDKKKVKELLPKGVEIVKFVRYSL